MLLGLVGGPHPDLRPGPHPPFGACPAHLPVLYSVQSAQLPGGLAPICTRGHLTIMAPRSRRALASATLFLGTCAILGSLISQRVAAQSATDESTLRDSLHSFTDVYSLVEQNYADKLNTDKADKAIYDGAIPGMLHTLDPHSNFYDPKAYAQMREDQHGKYYGVGMTIQPQPDKGGAPKIVVVYPFEGTPSFKAGIRPGDVILAINGKSTDNMDSTAVANSLKGPRGTHVSVTMASATCT